MHPIDVSKAKRLIPEELKVGLGHAKSAPHGDASRIHIEGLCDANGRPFQTFGTLMSRGFSNLYVSLLVPVDERSTGADIVKVDDMMFGTMDKHRRMLVTLADFIGVLYSMSGAAKDAAGATGDVKPGAGASAAAVEPMDSEVARLRRDNLRLRTDIETSRRLLGRLLEELSGGAPVQEAQPASQLLTLALLSRLFAGREP